MEKTPEFVKKAFDEDITREKRDYEIRRWFSSKKNRIDYQMMLNIISFHSKNIKFKKCLELGPGPGTWTKILLKQNPEAEFLLLDISKEMLNQAKKNFKGYKNIKYKQQDFLEFKSRKKFDFFFSSRVLEYIPDKKKAVKIIYNILRKNGKAIIITKEPHKFKVKIRKLLGKKLNPIDFGRISYKELETLLKKQGFRNIRIYPAIFPWFNSPFLQWIRLPIFNLLYKKKMNFLSKNLSESYLIKFEK